MNALRRWGSGSRVALVAVLSAVGLAAWVGVEAWRVDPLPEGRRGGVERLTMAEVATSGDAVPASVVFTAVSRDPFRSDRKRSLNRFRMPGEQVPSSRAGLRTPYAGIALLGTAVVGERGLAVLQMPREAARLVTVGDSIAGLQLVSVERRMVTLTGADTTMVLELPGPPGEAQRRTSTDTTDTVRTTESARKGELPEQDQSSTKGMEG